MHVAHIKATMNNTTVTIATGTGNVLAARSAGMCGFKGAKRGTTYAAQTVATEAATIAMTRGIDKIRVQLNGMGPGRASAMKGLQIAGINVVAVTDVTAVPHNGCRPKKARRL
eukprot:m.454026 g.454026  ORF g.454026 m.454026 type:complete len:113 (+) comp56943_c1_seq2:4376-4714(+)